MSDPETTTTSSFESTSENDSPSQPQQPSPTTTTTPTSQCDRRLSRAAHNILIHDILPILQHHHPEHTHRHHSTTTHSSTNSNNHNTYHTSTSAIQRQTTKIRTTYDLYSHLLIDLLSPSSADPTTCLLHPHHDKHWQDERNYDARISPSYVPRRKKSRLHICWMCRKSFASRYYLDLHLEEGSCRREFRLRRETDGDGDGDESASVQIGEDGRTVCPARDICHHLGESRCRHRALVDEPYYAPGNSQNASVARAHRRSYEDSLPSPSSSSSSSLCDNDEMALRRTQCHQQLIQPCFSMEENPSLVMDITAVLCDETWDCRRVGRDWHRDVRGGVVGGGGGVGDIHYGVVGAGRHRRREEWYAAHEGVRVRPGWLVTFLVVASFLHYCIYSLGGGEGDDDDDDGGGGRGRRDRKKER